MSPFLTPLFTTHQVVRLSDPNSSVFKRVSLALANKKEKRRFIGATYCLCMAMGPTDTTLSMWVNPKGNTCPTDNCGSLRVVCIDNRDAFSKYVTVEDNIITFAAPDAVVASVTGTPKDDAYALYGDELFAIPRKMLANMLSGRKNLQTFNTQPNLSAPAPAG